MNYPEGHPSHCSLCKQRHEKMNEHDWVRFHENAHRLCPMCEQYETGKESECIPMPEKNND